jgi:sugar transferase (PEP-CTERM/EpsH1 system associated)
MDYRIYADIWKLFRRLKPEIVHTRNLSTLEAQLPAFLAGVPCRIHGEHGRDMHDLDGTSWKYRLLRRFFRLYIQHYITVSSDLLQYLHECVGVPMHLITPICNGVDTVRFRPASLPARGLLPDGFNGSEKIIIGTVGRMEHVKDPLNLVHAFIHVVKEHPECRQDLRLLMIGNGSLREPAISLIQDAGLSEITWLPGDRDDVPELLQSMDVFVLPSLAEGISNTILEAMASGLPVVATDVGGNSELVERDTTGFLVPRSDPVALSHAIRRYIDDPELRRLHGARARRRCEAEFSIDTMVSRYQELYDASLNPDKKLCAD